ncbi:MAG: chemotaxis protein, partial [Rubrivivax sp.]|nr:chemotaxis protein [Rubrivivax sp.]
MHRLFRRAASPDETTGASTAAAASRDEGRAMRAVSDLTSTLGREAAEVRGVLDDTARQAAEQAAAVHELARRLGEVTQAQAAIGQEVAQGLEAVTRVGDAVQGVGTEVAGIVDTLKEVSAAAQEITQIALQTRLVAFNASVEAKRAGEAGRGFGVVADAVKDLAAQVEQSSKSIMGTVAALGTRIDSLSREVNRQEGAENESGIHRALASVGEGVQRIQHASDASREVCSGVDAQMGRIEADMRRSAEAVGGALTRTNAFLEISEKLIETVAGC